MPVVYFTQLLGLAFGFSAKELGLERNIVAAKARFAGKIRAGGGVELDEINTDASVR